MAITTITSRVFDRNPRKAKAASKDRPVVITDQGRPTHVLLTIEAYRQLIGRQESIVGLLAMPGAADIEFEAAHLGDVLYRPTHLS